MQNFILNILSFLCTVLFLFSCVQTPERLQASTDSAKMSVATEAELAEALNETLKPTAVLKETATLTPQMTATQSSAVIVEPAIESVVVTAEAEHKAFVLSENEDVDEDTHKDIGSQEWTDGPFTLVSRSSEAEQSNGHAGQPSISADGRYVAFTADASNLGSKRRGAVYVHDTHSGETDIVSVTSDGMPYSGHSPSISADGRYIVFISKDEELSADVAGISGTYLHDRHMGETSLISFRHPDLPMVDRRRTRDACPSISANGQFVVFHSTAHDLINDPISDSSDSDTQVFIHNQKTGKTQLVSIAIDGMEGNRSSICPVVSAEGRYVAFESKASNLTEQIYDSRRSRVYVRDMESGQTVLISEPSDASTEGYAKNIDSVRPAISADGKTIVFASTSIWHMDVAGEYRMVWEVRINRYDMQTQETQLVFVGDYTTVELQIDTLEPSISTNGRYITYWLGEKKLNPLSINNSYAEWTLYIVDSEHETTTPVLPPFNAESIESRHKQGMFAQPAPVVSADGSHIAFASMRTDIVPEQNTDYLDIFVAKVPQE